MTIDAGASGNDPQWLSEDERTAWLALTGLLVRLPGALDAQLERDSGLRFFEYMVLAMLAEQEDRTLRMSALAELTNGSLSRLSHVVQRLERQGLVRRATSAEDKRATNAILTDEGLARVESAAPGHVAHARALVVDAAGAEELETFGRVAWQILQRVGGWRT
ncbi:MarR family winged helix-turn-helix transcriptional regulator [Ruania halotolerans]|uniref:MarR family winged helix-turn-helix transcriptional regulator n=1 Tax=Ruania halotolerans TaxID=2897773 RepID=UPI001E3A1BD8|nr:MarR family transcriptional regulator [Ruania halotolerans]UFU06387.1 MarR family transcriptional regulator [Ruania halotolerans]